MVALRIKTQIELPLRSINQWKATYINALFLKSSPVRYNPACQLFYYSFILMLCFVLLKRLLIRLNVAVIIDIVFVASIASVMDFVNIFI